MNSFIRTALLLLLLLPTLVRAEHAINVAVASNFLSTAKKIAVEYEAISGVDVRFSSASTGLLYAQIINGAPFDLFLAADRERPLRLQRDGYAFDGQIFDYARGALVLWSNDPVFAEQDCYAALLDHRYRLLAIANPDTAPYGMAAKRFLQSRGLWDAAQGRIVYGENVSQTFQFVASGNATLGLLAKSQALLGNVEEASCAVPLEAPAVRHSGLVLRTSKHLDSALQFADFLSSPAALRILRQSGYTVGATADLRSD